MGDGVHVWEGRKGERKGVLVNGRSGKRIARLFCMALSYMWLFYLYRTVKIWLFYLVFPLADSMAKAFCWLIPLEL